MLNSVLPLIMLALMVGITSVNGVMLNSGKGDEIPPCYYCLLPCDLGSQAAPDQGCGTRETLQGSEAF